MLKITNKKWQREFRDKFHIEAELVTSSTVNRSEKDCNGESIFKVYPSPLYRTTTSRRNIRRILRARSE
jgi:hypothetical protein